MKFTVRPDDNELRDLELDVVEHQPYDPAAYQNEAGWLCEDMSGDTYFISEGGRVDKATEYDTNIDGYTDEVIVWFPTAWIMGWGECPEVTERWKMLLERETREIQGS